jgi:RNA polymerase sigma-70 factor, ECF subfamily
MKEVFEPGDLEAIATEFRSQIYAFILSRVEIRAAAEDLTQETFLKVRKALETGTEPEHFRGLLFQIARNTVFDFLKESKRFVALDERSETTEREQDSVTDSGDNKFREALFSYTLCAIQTLPVEDQEALILTEIDGLDRQELAEKLSISLSAAKSRVHRGRAKLRKVVDECCRLITDPYGRVIDWERRALKCCGPDRPRKAVLEHNQTRKST